MNPTLNVITSLTRTEYLPAMVNSIRTLSNLFAVNWIPIITGQPRESIGRAWNMAIERVKSDDEWCIILDDDNSIRPEFAAVFRSDIDLRGDGVDLFLFRQMDRNGKRFTWNPVLSHSRVDAAQFGFRARLARYFPFEDTNNCPDGLWANALASLLPPLRVVQSEAIANYNMLRNG
jgi:hypothetical protein